MEVIIFLVIAFFVYLYLTDEAKKPKTRRAPFKNRYDLDRFQPISEFEDKMADGMFKEQKEVFVTAFVNDTHVLRVTATIGGKYSCGPSDRTELWGQRAAEKGATEIRQYHNHPDSLGRSFPSSADRKARRVLKECTEEGNVEYHSFLVYRTWFGQVRIKEYN